MPSYGLVVAARQTRWHVRCKRACQLWAKSGHSGWRDRERRLLKLGQRGVSLTDTTLVISEHSPSSRGGVTQNYLSHCVFVCRNRYVVSDNQLALDRRCRPAHSDDNIRDVRSGNRSSLCP